MNGRFEINRDMPQDNRSDIRGIVGGEKKPDHGGDLARAKGIDLNNGTRDISATGSFAISGNEHGEDLNDTGTEHLDTALDQFKEYNWGDMPLEGKKQAIADLATCVAADTGNENLPEIVFRDDMPDGSYGGYSPDSNTIEINQNMLDDSAETVDTIAHEMWHAYQHQCAQDPTNEKGQEYQEGFEIYISPEYDFEGYENQMVKAEARDYAQGFKDRLKGVA